MRLASVVSTSRKLRRMNKLIAVLVAVAVHFGAMAQTAAPLTPTTPIASAAQVAPKQTKSMKRAKAANKAKARGHKIKKHHSKPKRVKKA